MAPFLSTFGLGARLIGGRRRRPQSKVAKARISYKTNNVINNIQNNFGCRIKLTPNGRKSTRIEEDTREKKKKKKKRGNGCCDNNEVVVKNRSNFNPNDDITIEILSRLPAKTLMRFKCVCKNWFFLIQKDTTFTDLQFERSKARPRLLINSQILDNKYVLMTFDLLFGGRPGGSVSAASVHTIWDIELTKYDIMLKPVNGLIGFFRNPSVCICNASTGEVTPWVESKLLRHARDKGQEAYSLMDSSNCALGYDPATKEYKVVCIWKSKQPYVRFKKTICEVLTVGDNKWRQTDEVPSRGVKLDTSYVCINGSIYYCNSSRIKNKAKASAKEKVIVAFDVGSEKFRTISVPNYIFDQPDCDSYYIFYSVRLLELNGLLGLLIKLGTSGTPKLWLFDDDRNQKNSTSSWTRVTMKLPYILDAVRRDFSLVPIPGTNQIILRCGSTYHSYNWKTKSFNEIEISGIPSSIPFFTSSSMFGIFSENLLPLLKHTSTLL